MDNSNPNSQNSALLGYLPSIFREGDFLGQFLMAFEKILLGRDDGVSIPSVSMLPVAHINGASLPSESLEETIAGLANLINPLKTRDEFLPWLMNWVALTLRADLGLEQQRAFISRIVQLYNKRGTKDNLIELLGIFTNPASAPDDPQNAKITIDEEAIPAIKENQPPRNAAHFFKVTIFAKNVDPKTIARQVEIAIALIELEKPAYTHYDLEFDFSSIQIGVRSMIGVDTLLGTCDYKQQSEVTTHA